MAYANGPYELPTNLPPPSVTVVPAARKIDWARGRYVFDANGNPASMDPTAQRVLLLVAFAPEGDTPGIIDDRALAARRAALEAAVQPLVDESAISNVVVTVTTDGAGAVAEQVAFHNLSTDQDVSVTING